MSWGEIYNTSWWGIALDTARTVKARPDFFGSQLNLLTSEQPNLVTNGTFDTDTDWSKGSNWTISGGSATSDGVNATSNLSQVITSFSGKTFLVEGNASNVSQGFAYVSLGGSDLQIVVNSSGAFKHYVTISSGNSTLFISGRNNFIGSIDNVSVQLVRAELDQIEAKKCLADWIHTTALKDLNN